jgi:hypothetical protein
VYRDDPSARRRWTTLSVALALGAVAASAALFATRAATYHGLATFALDVILAAALLALLRGAALARRRLMRRRRRLEPRIETTEDADASLVARRNVA